MAVHRSPTDARKMTTASSQHNDGAAAKASPAASTTIATARAVVMAKRNSGKKRRPVKLAPRFYHNDPAHAIDPRALEMNTENSTLLRDVFTTSMCRCFILKSFSDANFHKSLKYGVWSSTYAHNMMLDQIFQSDFSAVRPVLLFFSVCGTKHFSGIARMTSGVRTDVKFQLWEKPKYEGFFHVEWLVVKDVPNHLLTDIKMSNTPTKKSITSCRDCEEVLYDEANRFIDIFTGYSSRTSGWDDFDHYEHRQPALEAKRGLAAVDPAEFTAFIAPVKNA